ncbi:MAG: Uma2 family endonuclease [Spirulinaceae cyanobacterium RM2_2_10]|nr:Uma2 family endonuclease [Spirulinaceae cyanobacterium SM2_1_0]NJO21576.1 Uma2 family endonuclease [Spirulinaceae cyanobacterium RM2_2_10]
MIQAERQLVTFEEFLDTYPETGHYELHRGVIVELQPTGTHEDIAGFIIAEFNDQIRSQTFPYSIPRSGIVRSLDAESGYQPDVLVLNRPALADEPMWTKRSTITRGESVKIAIEVASTNWRDDYLKKLHDYELLGIPEYWIVDHLGLAAGRYIGTPKQPTISIYTLDEDEYQVNQFRGSDRLISPTFPDLDLTAEQVFQAQR